jgi:hypothetical protein
MPTKRVRRARAMVPGGEVVSRLPRDPVHLWQRTDRAGLYNNSMGCGAFSTAMAISVFQPGGFVNDGGYAIAHDIYDQMLKVPFSGGGTFEMQNTLALKAHGLQASMFLFGTFDHVAAAIDMGAPVIILINPIVLNIGQHDVLAVGYSRDTFGRPLSLFIDNPWDEPSTQVGPDGLNYPGNSKIAAADLPNKWTGTFTPVFGDTTTFNEWRQRTGYWWGIG